MPYTNSERHELPFSEASPLGTPASPSAEIYTTDLIGNSCNSCTPSIPDSFIVWLSGLADTAWAAYDGANRVTYSGVSGCTWRNYNNNLWLSWGAPDPPVFASNVIDTPVTPLVTHELTTVIKVGGSTVLTITNHTGEAYTAMPVLSGNTHSFGLLDASTTTEYFASLAHLLNQLDDVSAVADGATSVTITALEQATSTYDIDVSGSVPGGGHFETTATAGLSPSLGTWQVTLNENPHGSVGWNFPSFDNEGIMTRTGIATDECKPSGNRTGPGQLWDIPSRVDFGAFNYCDDFTSACGAAVGATCTVVEDVWSGSAIGRRRHLGGPWPDLQQNIIDLAEGDQTFTISWSIMRAHLLVNYRTDQGYTELNTTAMSTLSADAESEIQAAMVEWKNLFQSVFSIANGYLGDLTFNIVPKGVETGTSVASLTYETYSFRSDTGIPTTAYEEKVGDIRVGAVALQMGNDYNGEPIEDGPGKTLAVTTPPQGNVAGVTGGSGGDILMDAADEWRKDNQTPEYMAEHPYAFSIKLVAAHEIGHALGIGHVWDINPFLPVSSAGTAFPERPCPLMSGFLEPYPFSKFEDLFPDGLSVSWWERRSIQEIYGYPP